MDAAYIRDFARGLVVLSEHEEALGRVWYIPITESIATRQFVDLVGEEVDQPVQIRVASRYSPLTI